MAINRRSCSPDWPTPIAARSYWTTRRAGVDAGARQEIYLHLRRLVQQGAGIRADHRRSARQRHRDGGPHPADEGRLRWCAAMRTCIRRRSPKKPSSPTWCEQVTMTDNISATGAVAAASTASRREAVIRVGRQLVPYGVLIALVVWFAVSSDLFLTKDNLFNILRASSTLLVIAVGATLVVVAGSVDLSVGAVAVLAGTVAVHLSLNGSDTPLLLAVPIRPGVRSAEWRPRRLRTPAVILTDARHVVRLQRPRVAHHRGNRGAAAEPTPRRHGQPIIGAGDSEHLLVGGVGPRHHLGARISDPVRPTHLRDRWQRACREALRPARGARQAG